MAAKLLTLREYASTVLQDNVLKALHAGVTKYTASQQRRVFMELIEGECKSIMNYEFKVEDQYLKIYCDTKNHTPVWEKVECNRLADFDHLPIIDRFVDRHMVAVCDSVLKKQYPGIDFKMFLCQNRLSYHHGPLGCHFKASTNPTKLTFWWLPTMDKTV